MADKVYTAIELRPGAWLKVVAVPYKGRTMLHVREYFTDAHGEIKPGRGVAIKLEDVVTVRRAIQLAEKDLFPAPKRSFQSESVKGWLDDPIIYNDDRGGPGPDDYEE